MRSGGSPVLLVKMACRLKQYDDRVDLTENGKHQWSRARELQGPTYKPLKDAFWYVH